MTVSTVSYGRRYWFVMRSNDDLTNTGFQKLLGTAPVAKNCL